MRAAFGLLVCDRNDGPPLDRFIEALLTLWMIPTKRYGNQHVERQRGTESIFGAWIL
jgi:hypothetical protein